MLYFTITSLQLFADAMMVSPRTSVVCFPLAANVTFGDYQWSQWPLVCLSAIVGIALTAIATTVRNYSQDPDSSHFSPLKRCHHSELEASPASLASNLSSMVIHSIESERLRWTLYETRSFHHVHSLHLFLAVHQTNTYSRPPSRTPSLPKYLRRISGSPPAYSKYNARAT